MKRLRFRSWSNPGIQLLKSKFRAFVGVAQTHLEGTSVRLEAWYANKIIPKWEAMAWICEKHQHRPGTRVCVPPTNIGCRYGSYLTPFKTDIIQSYIYAIFAALFFTWLIILPSYRMTRKVVRQQAMTLAAGYVLFSVLSEYQKANGTITSDQ